MLGPLDFWLWTSGAAVVIVGARVQDASAPLVLVMDAAEPLVRVTDDSAVLVTVTDAQEA
jgi:hypothetical protein